MTAQKALSLTFEDTRTLLAAYMPALERGGLFVPIHERFELGQRVYLLLRLPGEQERIPVSGDVAWISPVGVSGRRTPGIGVHFDPSEHKLRERIEKHLEGMLDKEHPSYTL